MKHIIIFLFICIAHVIPSWSQDNHEHHHERNEIGISGGSVYVPDHKTWGSSIHIHYFRTLNPHSKWSWGANLEQVWDQEDGHFTIGAGFKYQIVDRLSVGLLPGITFHHHDGHDHRHDYSLNDSGTKSAFSMHFEAIYDLFHWKHFHLGPAVDYSWSKEDSHFMIGIHAAYCF